MERKSEAASMLQRFEQGEKRAHAGKLIVIDAVRGIQNPAEVTTYIMGYMKSVTASLSEIGITEPAQLGVHESFMHIVVQDPNVEGTTGIEGLYDGTRAVEPADIHSHLDESSLNHYRDGYSIGVAFARANARRGKFEALAGFDEIPKQLRELLSQEVKVWLKNWGIDASLPEFFLRLSPIARLSFSYGIVSGEKGFTDYSKKLKEKVMRDASIDQEEKEILAAGIKTSFDLSQQIKLRRIKI